VIIGTVSEVDGAESEHSDFGPRGGAGSVVDANPWGINTGSGVDAPALSGVPALSSDTWDLMEARRSAPCHGADGMESGAMDGRSGREVMMERFRRTGRETTLLPTFSAYQWTKASMYTASAWSRKALFFFDGCPVM
jgi:hypothetical protein